MPDIRCKDRKTGEEKTLPEPVFDVINDGRDDLEFLYYVDEKGNRQGAETIAPPQVFAIPVGAEKPPVEEPEDPTLDKNLYYVRGPKKGQLKET